MHVCWCGGQGKRTHTQDMSKKGECVFKLQGGEEKGGGLPCCTLKSESSDIEKLVGSQRK